MWKFLIAWIVVLLFVANEARAACEFRPTETAPMTTAAVYQMPVSVGKISVGPDMPIGKEIYRQTINIATNRVPFVVGCDTSPIKRFYKYTQLPLPASSVTMEGYSGTVYETGLKGVGIAFWYNKRGFPTSTTICAVSACSGSTGEPALSDFSLVKIGPVEPGEINGSNLPSVEYSVGVSEADSVTLVQISFVGSMNLSVPTCQLEQANSVVWMGTQKISEFSGKGSAGQWKDASIRLVNCPFFYGNTAGSGTSATFNGENVNSSSLVLNNTWNLTLTPSRGFIDSNTGIIAINDDDDQSASGVGIQLASAPLDSSVLNLSSAYSGGLPVDGSANVTI
uniref:fimbrial protein n=1 Tax=Serratia marcescens TaxID=615 RepID=UPI0011E85A0A